MNGQLRRRGRQHADETSSLLINQVEFRAFAERCGLGSFQCRRVREAEAPDGKTLSACQGVAGFSPCARAAASVIASSERAWTPASCERISTASSALHSRLMDERQAGQRRCSIDSWKTGTVSSCARKPYVSRRCVIRRLWKVQSGIGKCVVANRLLLTRRCAPRP